jgi:hypothetical protein
MSKLLDALQQENVRTENGMTTNSTSLNHCVDLFFQIGAMRGQDKGRLIDAFSKAYSQDPLTAMKLAFWARDVRGGAGERQIFRDIVTHLAKHHKDSIGKNIHLIAEFGRWDDVLTLIGTRLEKEALETITGGLKAENQLCAKWMPREGGSRTNKAQFHAIRKHLKLSPKEYRNLIVGLSNTVEQAMCSKNWDNIDYNKLPSKAMANYMKAFSKNDGERFQEYLDALDRGDSNVKINAGAVYPYDIIKTLRSGQSQGANAQWEALPNFLEGSEERFIPIIDVSASMFWPEAKISGDLYAGHVGQSLSLYISERNEGPFKDAVMTFASNPSLAILKGNLEERYNQLQRIGVGGSTNLEAVYQLILSQAKKHSVPESEMPTMIIIFSDMEFNRGTGSGWSSTSSDWNPTAQQMAEEMYAQAGYQMPKVVYWNLAARNANVPVKFDKQGTCLISGFSPSILKSLLSGVDLSPLSMMLTVINSDRYSQITV